ncbi:porin [Caballeronia sp. LP006]|uniref:porin n=1 Tax=Caballeronia sp. LP006 TaxID=3038552 RepID=UPI0028649211|nr:porin [Caballeronia sp. LP006]MDR5826321.1 porin [Caballeronia sp. LP006]
MKTRQLAYPCLLCAAFYGSEAFAQSSVTLYGLISGGLAYSTNQSGHHSYQTASGTNQSPRWGLQGKEDIGGGTSVIFTLENGFNILNGTASYNARMFGRQAFVGLSNSTWGTVTFGRQYDSVEDLLDLNTGYNWNGTIGDNDNTYNNLHVNNAVKYTSPTYGGIRATAMYGFSNSASGFSDNRSFGGGLSYQSGPFNWNIAYTEFDHPYSATNQTGALDTDYAVSYLTFDRSALTTHAYADKQRIFGTGGFYNIGALKLGALYTDVNYFYLDGQHLNLQNFSVSANYMLHSDLLLGMGYVYTTGKYSITGSRPRWRELNLAADYFLSKRTDIALIVYLQEAGGGALADIQGYYASSTNRQLVTTLGIRHKF